MRKAVKSKPQFVTLIFEQPGNFCSPCVIPPSNTEPDLASGGTSFSGTFLLPSKSAGNDVCTTVNCEAGIIKIIWSLPLCFKNWTPWQVAKIKHQRGPPQARLRINIHVRAHHLLTLTAGKKSWRHLLGGQGSGWPGCAAQAGNVSVHWVCLARLCSGAAGASCERGSLCWIQLAPPQTHCWLTITPHCPALLGLEGKLS